MSLVVEIVLGQATEIVLSAVFVCLGWCVCLAMSSCLQRRSLDRHLGPGKFVEKSVDCAEDEADEGRHLLGSSLRCCASVLLSGLPKLTRIRDFEGTKHMVKKHVNS